LAALELKIPISIVEIMGEAYMGQGLGFEYFHNGAAGNYGAFNAKGHGILSRGGWLQASVKRSKKSPLTLGMAWMIRRIMMLAVISSSRAGTLSEMCLYRSSGISQLG